MKTPYVLICQFIVFPFLPISQFFTFRVRIDSSLPEEGSEDYEPKLLVGKKQSHKNV